MLTRVKSIQKNGQGSIFPGDPHSSRHLCSKWFQAARDCCLIFEGDWKHILKPKFKPYKFPGNSPSLWLPKCSDSIFFFFFWLVISSSHRLTHYFYFLRIKVTLFIGMAAWRLTPRIIIAWRETKVKHMHLNESETREIIKMRVMLIQFAKVYKALLHIWSIIIYNKLGGK